MPEYVSPISPKHPPTAQRLRELAFLFLKLGTVAFGGPAAHIAMMDDEVVRKRQWLSREQFLDLMGVANLIPGPSSTEMAIYVGYSRAGVRGLIVAGICFILPAMLMVGVLAWVYQTYGMLPSIQQFLYGVKPVVIAIIAQALWRLGKTAVKTPFLAAVGIAALVAAVLGANIVAILFGAAFLTLLVRSIATRRTQHHSFVVPILASTPVAATLASVAPVGLWSIFLVFLKIGSVIFGSGYVLLAFLQDDLVSHHHWLTQSQLLDSVVVGQITPGPVFTTATFIGYLLAGPKGALVATIGIFLPGFIFVAITAPIVRRLRHSKFAANFLDGLNVASLALMAFVAWQLGRAALTDPLTMVIAAIAALLLIWKNINSVILLVCGGAAGVIWHWFVLH